MRKPTIGDIIKTGEKEWIILDMDEEITFLLSKYSIKNMAFSKSNYNNWWKSEIRSYLYDEFLQEFISSIMDYGITTYRNTISLSGLNEYRDTTDLISVLSLDEYKKYRMRIPTINENWWLLTPVNVTSDGQDSFVVGVKPNGSIEMFEASRKDVGVRPIIRLYTKFFEKDKDLISRIDEIMYKTREEIIKEIQKEMKKCHHIIKPE